MTGRWWQSESARWLVVVLCVLVLGIFTGYVQSWNGSAAEAASGCRNYGKFTWEGEVFACELIRKRLDA